MPKAPKVKSLPSTPTPASYVTRAGMMSAGMGQRPNKLIPIIGRQTSTVGRPSLLGGV